MSLIKKLFSTMAVTKQEAVGHDITFSLGGNAAWTNKDYNTFSKVGYENNAIGYKAIHEISKACANVPFNVYIKKSGELLHAPEHPVNFLLESPNRQQSYFELMFSVYAMKLITGNSYLQFAFSGDGGVNNLPAGELKKIYNLRPDRMKVKPDSMGYIQSYVHTVNGMQKNFDVDVRTGHASVLHIKEFSATSDWYGFSPLEAAMSHVDLFNHGNELNLSLLQNGARLGVALSIKDGFVDDKQRENLLSDFVNAFTGSKKSHKPIMLEGGMDIKELGQSPKDIEFSEGNAMAARIISLTLGLPPFMLGLPGDNTFNNMREAKQHFYSNTVKPTVEHVFSELTNYFNAFYSEDIVVLPDFDKLEVFQHMRLEKWDKLQSADFLTINEKRAELGFDKLDDALADEIWQPVGKMPINFSGPAMPEIEEDLKDIETGIEFKLINNLTDTERVREVRIADRLMSSLENRFEKQVYDTLNSHAHTMADNYQKSPATFVPNTEAMEAVLHNLYESHYRRTADLFGKRILESFKSFSGGFETKDRDGIFNIAVSDYIRRFAGEKVQQVSAHTRELVKASLFAGEEAQETPRETAKRIISQTGGGIAKMRATRIARTETHSTAMFAQDAAADATGLELKHEWISAEDSRTRPSHASADGQLRAKGDKFDVGGVKMDRPGDPSAPAGEIVNCRCVVGYLTQDALQERSDTNLIEQKAVSRVPPESARNNARRGLELRKKYGRGGTEVGLRNARKIASGEALSRSLIADMSSFVRHQENYKPDEREPDGGQTAGTIAWLLWGGTTGVKWASRTLESIDRENDSE